jgi:hypothetical protein
MVSGTPSIAGRAASEDAALTAMLLDLEDVQRIVETPDLEARQAYHQFWSYVEVSRGICSGVPFNSVDFDYRGSRFHAVSGMTMYSSGDAPDAAVVRVWVDEAVVRFDGASDAHRFVTDSAPRWRSCAGTQIRAVVEEGAGAQLWTIGRTEDIPATGTLVVTTSLAGAPGYVCKRALKNKADLVIDVVVCRDGVTEEAQTIVERIANRLPV